MIAQQSRRVGAWLSIAVLSAGVLLGKPPAVFGAEPAKPAVGPQQYLVEVRLYESESAATKHETPMAAARVQLLAGQSTKLHLGRQLALADGEFIDVGTVLKIRLDPPAHAKVRVKYSLERSTGREQVGFPASAARSSDVAWCVANAVLTGLPACLEPLIRLAIEADLDPTDENAAIVTQAVKISGISQIKLGKSVAICDVTDGSRRIRGELTVQESNPSRSSRDDLPK